MPAWASTGGCATFSAGKLSAGQRRRVALAAVVARQPDLWLLDEPHAGLDAAGRDLLDELVREAAAAGATVLLASHELERAANLATRSVVIAGGQIRDGLLAPPTATPADPAGAPDPAGTANPAAPDDPTAWKAVHVA